MRRLLSTIGILAMCGVAGCGEEREATAPSAPDEGASGPVTLAGTDHTMPDLGALDAWAVGEIGFTVPPEVFGGQVGNDLSFTAFRLPNGRVGGWYHYEQTFMGEVFIFSGTVSCIEVYDGQTRAKIGGPITASNDRTIPVGIFGWWQSLDDGSAALGPPDRNTLLGFGDEDANEAFCASPDPPRFGPFDVSEGPLMVD